MIGRDCTIIDIGGQDTKYINVVGGKPVDFLMNDKCGCRNRKVYRGNGEQAGAYYRGTVRAC